MRSHSQFFRYAAVGIVSNIISYLLYLLATGLGVGPKSAMSFLYIMSVLQTFVFNKKWAFRFEGPAAPALARYAVSYAVGYVINMLALMVLVDQVGLPHQWVQGVMILVIASIIFMAQKYWVFSQAPMGNVR